MSTRVDGARTLVLVIARATLSAGPVHLTLFRKGRPRPRNLAVQPHRRPGPPRCLRAHRRKDDHLDVLRYAAGICAASYQPGTTERGLLEQFVAAPPHEDSPLP